jgi:hypothetical protein
MTKTKTSTAALKAAALAVAFALFTPVALATLMQAAQIVA